MGWLSIVVRLATPSLIADLIKTFKENSTMNNQRQLSSEYKMKQHGSNGIVVTCDTINEFVSSRDMHDMET